MKIDTLAQSDPVRRRLRRLSPGERREEAVSFLRQLAKETGMDRQAVAVREKDVLRSLKTKNHYDHTPDELAFGARVAWRNHSRCIGRLHWKSLVVRDLREVTQPNAIAEHMFEHMRQCFSDGRIRSTISMFAPVRGHAIPATIENEQILQYAGYLGERKGGQSLLGDPKSLEIARKAEGLGWRVNGTRTAFDFVPLIVRDARGRRSMHEIPADVRREVLIEHPIFPAIRDLGMRWYAVPCMSNMVLTIGGIDYPCAPFNGHYMATEIASRDLADLRRYDMLMGVARALGFECGDDDPLWKDRALTELNRAVLYSFGKRGIDIVDHHTASRQFMEFVKLEQAAGRMVSADWSWIVPPQASAGCPVFHLPMQDLNLVPNFYTSRALDGEPLRVDYRLERRGKWWRRYQRAKRRLRRWFDRREARWI